MAMTLGITGMDASNEAQVRAAFADANAATGERWTLVEGDRADVVVVDMDSLYGPMSWLRLHAAGKTVIGLTAMERCQTDHRLQRPVEAGELARLLAQLAGEAPAPAPAPVQSTPAPAPGDELPAPAVAADLTEAAPDLAPAMAGLASPEAAQGAGADIAPPGGADGFASAAAMDAPAPAERPEPLLPPDRSLAHWLRPGGLTQRVRFQRDGGPVLLVDPQRREWHGPSSLKPLAGYFEGTLEAEDFKPVDAADWEREATALGAAQPIARLQWLGGLVRGEGALLPGLDPEGRYRLTKWPQTEREYPKHFRVATAMMKGPATVAEVAEASGVPPAEVADFFNANLATGFAEFVPPAPPEPAEPPPKPAGLLGRLRGR
jgi:hypothetical protein